MANPVVWRPELLPAERQDRQIRGAFPVSSYGYLASATPVSRGRTYPAARQKGADNEKEYVTVHEQTLEPEEAAVHDFWWVP